MNKTILVRKAVTSHINAALTAAEISGVKVYYQQAPSSHPQKYIVFTCEELMRQDGRIAMELEVNCIDYGTDSSGAENLADIMQKAFDHAQIMTDDIFLYTYAGVRNTVTSEDVKAIRRRCTFDLYLYERG